MIGLRPSQIQDKDTRQLAVAAIAQGWLVTCSASHHLRWLALDGSIIFSSSTPSDTRSWKNLRSRLRRHGLEI